MSIKNTGVTKGVYPNSLVVHLQGYGWIKVFRTVGTNGNAEYWATNKLDMTIQQAADYALDAWQIGIHRLQRQVSYFEAKTAIIRDAIRAYLAHPTLVLQPTA